MNLEINVYLGLINSDSLCDLEKSLEFQFLLDYDILSCDWYSPISSNVIWTHGQDNLWLFLCPYTLGSVFGHPSPKVTKAGDIKIDTDMLKYCFDQQTLPLGSYYNDA